MDPCLPNTSLGNARIIARVKLGVPEKYTKKMTVAHICKAMTICRSTTILPPMNSSEFEGKRYMIDPKSPISAKDFVLLFGTSGTLSDCKRIARIFGLSTDCVSKNNLKSNIIQALQGLKISEPIEIPTKGMRKKSNNTVSNLPSSNLIKTPNNQSVSNNQITPNNNPPPSGEEPEPELTPASGEHPYSENVAPNAVNFVIPKTHPTKVNINNTKRTPSSSENNEASAIKRAAEGQERTLSEMRGQFGRNENVNRVVNDTYGVNASRMNALKRAIG